MTIKEVTRAITSNVLRLQALRLERNDLIKKRYKELYNIDTWHKFKAEYVYSTIAKESGLSPALVKKVILTNK